MNKQDEQSACSARLTHTPQLCNAEDDHAQNTCQLVTQDIAPAQQLPHTCCCRCKDVAAAGKGVGNADSHKHWHLAQSATQPQAKELPVSQRAPATA
jgi:hypothetical protein